ncbi:MAG: OmpA family protein [Pararhodobacter sp.]|nr:OmpA family protein [Pararhodobacter sp.]
MNVNSLKSTTAILVTLSFLQPLPALAQSSSGARSDNTNTERGASSRARLLNSRTAQEICSQAGITDELACELYILELETEAEALAAEEAADEAEAGAAREVEADADAAAEAEARAADEAEIRAARESEAEAQAAAEAAAHAADEAEAGAAREVEADADAAAEAEARAADEAEIRAARESDAEAQAEADARADADAEAEARAAAETEAAEPIGTLLDETTAALAAETEEADEVTTEIVTERSRRSSREEFRDWSREDRDRGETEEAGTTTTERSRMSDLERAGLFVLGAVAVGAILSSGQRVESNTGDRIIVVDDDGVYRVFKDDDALLRQPGSEVRTERFADGSTRTEVIREDGTRIITIRDASGRALRRLRIEPDGREYLLIDDTRDFEPVIVRDLPRPARESFDYQAASDRESLRLALLAADRRDIGRSFSLRQVREIVEVRELAPEINLGGITFATNSAAIQQSQAEQLREMGLLMQDLIRDNPVELFLVEGHTDAIGSAGHNLLLSDRRAESVALAFSEYFGVPAENMVVQGYGESFLKIPTQAAERLNRRVAVRRITALVRPY